MTRCPPFIGYIISCTTTGIIIQRIVCLLQIFMRINTIHFTVGFIFSEVVRNDPDQGNGMNELREAVILSEQQCSRVRQ